MAASVLLLSGANAQEHDNREYYCWGHWNWNNRPDCGRWQNHDWVSDLTYHWKALKLLKRSQYPYWFNHWVSTRELQVIVPQKNSTNMMCKGILELL